MFVPYANGVKSWACFLCLVHKSNKTKSHQWDVTASSLEKEAKLYTKNFCFSSIKKFCFVSVDAQYCGFHREELKV